MNSQFLKSGLLAARAMQKEADQLRLPPPISMPSHSEMILPNSLTKDTRKYIEIVAHQINRTYECACYDGCAVMIRRLVGTLIIEAFERYNIANKLKTPGGDFPYLKELVTQTLSETNWNLSRNTRQALPRLKEIGDLAAHNRRYNAHRHDIDKIIPDLRVVVQELLAL